MYIKIYPENPNEKSLQTAVQTLVSGGVLIIPTDTVYAFACDLKQFKAAEKLAQLKNKKIEKATFSILCSDLSQISDYVLPISNPVFRMMKEALPGPYTFIMSANSKVPKIFQNKRRTIGVRIPKQQVCLELAARLGNPLLVSSIPSAQEVEMYTDPELIYETYEKSVDLLVDGGLGGIEPSTVLDCTSAEVLLVRQGKGRVFDQFL